MNNHEIDRIAASMHQLRPDWPVASLRTLITNKLGDRPRRDVAVALAWVACEPTTTTPARVLETGPWWKAAGVEGGAHKLDPYDPNRHCHACGKGPHGSDDHEYVSASEWQHRIAKQPTKRPIRELIKETNR